MARRVTSAVILAAFLAIAAFALLGDRLLGGAFVLVEGVVLAHHALRTCGRCTNAACGFNRRCRGDGASIDDTMRGFSDLPITRTTVVPLLAAYPLAVFAAWRFSPLATIGTGAVGLAAHSVFRRLTCGRCGNDCLGNCNPDYRAWKASGRART